MNTVNPIVCVARTVGRNLELVAAKGRVDLVDGERTVTGRFRSYPVQSGPSGSHMVTCHLPLEVEYGQLDLSAFRAAAQAMPEIAAAA